MSLVGGVFVLIFLSQAQDLLLEPRTLQVSLIFAFAILMFWAMPMHLSARKMAEEVSTGVTVNGWKALTQPQKARILWVMAGLDRWLPRIIGLMAFVVVLIAIARALGMLSGLEGLEREVTASRLQLCGTIVAVAVAALLYGIYLLARSVILRQGHSRIGRMIARYYSGPLSRWTPWAYYGFAFGTFAWALIWPLDFTAVFGRATLVPVLLGAWLPMLTWVAVRAHRVHFPLTASLLIALFVISNLQPNFHDLRTIESPKLIATRDAVAAGTVPAEPRQILLQDAIDAWRAANDCSAPLPCPAVVLVAAAGGGSRAAFFTNTVLGSLLDITRSDPATYRDFARSLFAISAVSGGAVGAVLTRTALEDGGSAPPCKAPGTLWFGYGEDGRDATKSWRACLQQLAVGDFLSPTVAGLVLRDNLALWPFLDRAALLEQAIERQYNYSVHDQQEACGGPEDLRGICRPLGYRQPSDAEWLPLLILNATSIATGNIVVASDLKTSYLTEVAREDGVLPNDLLPGTYSIYELMAASTYDPTAVSGSQLLITGTERAPDIRLSTAAVISARFPIVSPAANIRNEDELVTQTVDGGYFSNAGYDALEPIIDALRAQNLRPIVISIDSQAQRVPGSAWLLPGRFTSRASSVLPKPQRDFIARLGVFLGALAEPLLAVNAVRNARGESALSDFVGRVINTRDFFRPGVSFEASFQADSAWCIGRPQAAAVSGDAPVSWWLSPVAQRFLDVQLCATQNAYDMDHLLKRLRHEPVFK